MHVFWVCVCLVGIFTKEGVKLCFHLNAFFLCQTLSASFATTRSFPSPCASYCLFVLCCHEIQLVQKMIKPNVKFDDYWCSTTSLRNLSKNYLAPNFLWPYWVNDFLAFHILLNSASVVPPGWVHNEVQGYAQGWELDLPNCWVQLYVLCSAKKYRFSGHILIP